MSNNQLSTHFKRSEFACKCDCGFADIDLSLVNLLEEIRNHFDLPVIITSACRCENHNKKVGGKINSQHRKGTAADIIVKGIAAEKVADYIDDHYPFKFGLGRYNTFTHIDVRASYARWAG